MLSKERMLQIAAGVIGVVIAYLIVGFLTSPKSGRVVDYSVQITARQNETIGPVFYWDYLNVGPGEEFIYEVDCKSCVNDTLTARFIDSLNDELTVFLDMNINRYANETLQGYSVNLTIETTRTSFLSEIETNLEYYPIYSIFEEIIKPFINELAWTNLSLTKPNNFSSKFWDYQIVISSPVIINGFSCRPVTLSSEFSIVYSYCINEDLGMPVRAVSYLSPELISKSITLISHEVG